MIRCTYRLSLDELLKQPVGLLALHGAEGDPVEPDPNKAEKTGDDPDDSGDKSGDKDGDKPKEPAEPDAKDKRIKGLEEEKDRHAKLRKTAEDKVKLLEKEVKDLKAAGSTDEDLKTELSSVKTANEKLAATNREQALKIAFLTDNTYKWKSGKAALKLADLSEVEVDDDGTVHGMASALEKLAKEESYLLAEAEDADAEKDKDKKAPPRKTGDNTKPPAPNSEAAKQAAALKLKRKYPALRR